MSVPYHTLERVEELDYQADKANGNIIVEGDNLTALKALLPEYAGKVKCIYIDPPYNTGEEHWIYNDNVNSPIIKNWIGKEVGKDDLTKHDKWLCMMTPRLKLLRELLALDPLEKITAPKAMIDLKPSPEEKADPFTETEMQLILDHSNMYKRNHYLRNFILLMFASGMRPGEVAALKWSDICFDKKTIRVSRTRIRGKDGPPKTEASYRVVDMLPLAEEALRDQYENTKNYEYVFISSEKKPFYSHDVVGVNFQRILKATGVKVRVLYNLRHTYASHMIRNGVDIVYISKQLGHENPNITLTIYTRFIEEDDEKRLKKIAEIGTKMVTFKKGDS